MSEVGRPTVMTEDVLNKLEQGFMLGLNDREACLYAGISTQTLYNYQHDNPQFVERKEELKENIKMRAKANIAAAITDELKPNLSISQWYVERKDPEFNSKQAVDITSKGERIDNVDAVKELSEKFNDFLRTQQ